MLKMKLAAPDANKHARTRTTNGNSKGKLRSCNLCGVSFKAPTVYCCFCDDCKQHNELYRFHDWLPDELAVA